MGMPAASDCLVPLGILGSVQVQGLTNSEHKGSERALLYRLVLIAASVWMPVSYQPGTADSRHAPL